MSKKNKNRAHHKNPSSNSSGIGQCARRSPQLALQKAVQFSAGSPTCIANLARAYVLSGKRSEALELLSGLKKRSNPDYSNASEIAMIYASLGDTDQAMNWLEKGYEERFNPGVLLRPGFDPLRSDSRFQNLARRIGLPG